MVLTSKSWFQPVWRSNDRISGLVLTLTQETEPETPPADAPPTREQQPDEDEEDVI